MRLVLARVLWNFDLKLDGSVHGGDLEEEEEEVEDEDEGRLGSGSGAEKGLGQWQKRQRVFLIWEKRDLIVKLTPRV